MSPAENEREGRVTVTLPRLLREQLRATLEQRGWLDAQGRPQRGAAGEVVVEWLLDYARLKGWGQVSAPPAERPAAPPQHAHTEAPDEDDFNFKD